MFSKADVVKTTPLAEFSCGNPHIRGGIREEHCRLIDVKPGVLPYMSHMHPTRVFHKAADRDREHAAIRIVELIAPDIAVSMTPDSAKVRNKGVYMRFIRGKPISFRRTLTPQHRFDIGCISVLDALIGNQDRHGGNAMVTKVHVYPIDHGSCFGWGTLGRSFYLVDSYGAGCSLQNPSVYAGICATLERVHRYAVDISGIADTVKYIGSPNDIREWATNMKKKAGDSGRCDGNRANSEHTETHTRAG